jgi:threonine dehydrogenase-like Zn-dependent dehydrogenase
VKRYMPQLLDHVRAGRIAARELFTHRYPLERASEAYHVFAQKRDECIKPLILPQAA